MLFVIIMLVTQIKNESESAIITAYFGPPQGIDNGNKDSCSNGNTSVTEEDVMAFIASLNYEEH